MNVVVLLLLLVVLVVMVVVMVVVVMVVVVVVVIGFWGWFSCGGGCGDSLCKGGRFNICRSV